MHRLTLIVINIPLFLACGPAAALPGSGGAEGTPSGTTCVSTYDIVATPGTTYEDVATGAEIAWPTPGATFVASVVRVSDAVRIEGVLTNTTDAPLSVDYLTGGATGLSTNPFQVDIDVLPVTAVGPEVYPTARRVVLPPRGTVTFRTDRCPTFPANVHWTFSPWSGSAVQGSVTIP